MANIFEIPCRVKEIECSPNITKIVFLQLLKQQQQKEIAAKCSFYSFAKKCYTRNPVKWINSNFHSSKKTQMTNIFQGPLSSKVFFGKWVTSKCMKEEFGVKRRRKLFINKNFPILSLLSLYFWEFYSSPTVFGYFHM